MSFTHNEKTYIFHPKLINDLKESGLISKYKVKEYWVNIDATIQADESRCRDCAYCEIMHNLPLKDEQIIRCSVYNDGKSCNISFCDTFESCGWILKETSSRYRCTIYFRVEFTCIVLK